MNTITYGIVSGYELTEQVAKLKSPYSNGKLTGSLRRRSMDLTRALAELRKP
jgi:hypothetical protein